jgi:hypothetical protein
MDEPRPKDDSSKKRNIRRRAAEPPLHLRPTERPLNESGSVELPYQSLTFCPFLTFFRLSIKPQHRIDQGGSTFLLQSQSCGSKRVLFNLVMPVETQTSNSSDPTART